MKTRLSKPQLDLLKEIDEDSRHVARTYLPAQKLEQLGFAKWKDGMYGGGILSITDDGRKFLTAEELP